MGAGNRISAAVEMLRAMRDDGFSIDALLQVALEQRLAAPDRAADEHPHIVEIYRQEIGGPPRAWTLTATEPAPVDPEAPVFANFMQRWPGAVADNRARAAEVWRSLPAAEQARAIAFIGPYYALRREACLRARISAVRYLSARPWAAA